MRRLLALVSILAPLFFFLVLTLDGLLRPGYSPIRQLGSDLGVGPNAWVFALDVALLGLFFIAFALRLSQTPFGALLSPRRWLAAVTLLMLAGLGALVVAFFPKTDPLYHGLGANLLFLSAPLAQLIVGAGLRPFASWRGYALYSLASGGLSFALALFGLLNPLLQFIPPLLPVAIFVATEVAGLYQRLVLVLILAWFVVTGLRLLSLFRAQTALR